MENSGMYFMLTEEENTEAIQTITKKDDEVHCVVCNALCDGGYHFDAQTCNACAAFFRRTVSERRQYDCKKSPACQIEQTGIQTRNTCRSCRYEKCLAAGMLPEKIRNIWKSHRETVYQQFETMKMSRILQISEPDIGLNDIVHFYRAHKQLRQQKYQLPNASNPPLTTFRRFAMIFQCEPCFAQRFVKSCATKLNFTDSDGMIVLKNFTDVSRIAEESLMIASQDGMRLKRFTFMDGSFIPATLTGFTKFIAEFPPNPNSPSFLASVIFPSIAYQMNMVASVMEDMKLDETEVAALLNLILFNPNIPCLSSQAKEIVFNRRQVILNDLHNYYENIGRDTAVRFGNLVLLLSPIKECDRQHQEAVQILRLARAPSITNQAKKRKMPSGEKC